MPPRQTPAELEGQGPPSADANLPGSTLDQGGFGAFDPTAGGIGAMTPEDRKDSGASSFDDWLDGLFGGSLSQRNADDVPLGAGVNMEGLGVKGTVETVVNKVSRLNTAEISYLQRRLYQGGFFPAGAYTNSTNITWGLWDPTSMQALTVAIESASVNGVQNFDRFLEEQRIRFAQEGTTAADGRNVGSEIEAVTGAKTYSIELMDPESVQLMAESTAAELLGRKPTEQELSKITAKIHERQREAQKARVDVMEQSQAIAEPDLSENAALLKGESNLEIPYDPNVQAPPLDAEQLYNVAEIVSVAQDMGLGDEYVVAAISAAMVESGIRNIGFGDKDSIGMYQQRDHYGTKAQRMNPRWATQKFFEEMLRYSGDTLGEWVANTQRPAKQYRGRYDDVMSQAASIFATHITSYGGAGKTDWMSNQDDGVPSMGPGDIPTTGVGMSTAWGKLTGQLPESPGQIGKASDAIQPSGDPAGGAPPPGAFWLDSMLGSSGGDPIFREGFTVDPDTITEMELRRSDPKAYETKKAASKAVEFFSLLGAGGGMTGALPG